MGLWVPLLAAAWLIPNHYYPWATFHSDAWVAVSMGIVAASVILCTKARVSWHGLTVVMACLTAVPFLQFAVGMLPFSGQAWLYTAYVWGFVLALLTGARWESETPARAADALLLAVGIAALVSVGMQLRQWLGLAVADLGDLQVWAEEFTPGRPSANLGQPNQLATLLLWGLMGCAWAIVTKRARWGFGLVAAVFVIFGVALTQSRAGFVAMVAITVCVWNWRRLLPPRFPQVMTLLLLYFVICSVALQPLSDWLGLGVQIRPPSLGGASSMLRIKAYRLFLDAVSHRPLWGYGWDQLAVAQLEVAQDHGTLTSFFLHSHNLFLDLVLWCGLPLGGFVSLYLVSWLYRSIRKVSTAEDIILVLFLVIVGVHAMVELPLHHAYFLLPTGLVMGILNQRQHRRVFLTSGRWSTLAFWFTGCLLLAVIIKDYLRIDESFRRFRLDAAHIGNLPPGPTPEVFLLNQMSAFVVNTRVQITPDIKAEDLKALRGLTTSFPTPANLFNYAKALAFLNRPEEARAWISKVQKVQPAEFNPDMRRIWEAQAKQYPAMAAVVWPDLIDLTSVTPDRK